MKTKYVCLNCNADIHKHLIDKQLAAGLALDMVKCPECGKEFVAPRGKTLKKWQMDHPEWHDKTFWFTTPESVKVRNFRKMVIKGQSWNGMPLIERGDYVWQWGYNSIRKCWQWIPMVKTRAAFVRDYIQKKLQC